MLERTLHSSTTRAPLQLGTLTERVINPACCQPRTRGMDSKSVEARPVRSVSLRVCAFRRCCPHYLLEKLMLDCRAPLAPQATARKQCLLKASHAHGSPMGPCSGNFYTLYSHESEQCIEAIKPWALAHKSPSHSLVYLHVCVCVQRHARTWLFKKLCLESRPGIVQMDSSTLSPEEAQLCGSLQGRPLSACTSGSPSKRRRQLSVASDNRRDGILDPLGKDAMICNAWRPCTLCRARLQILPQPFRNGPVPAKGQRPSWIRTHTRSTNHWQRI